MVSLRRMTDTKPLCACGKTVQGFSPDIEALRAKLAKANGKLLRPITLCAECSMVRIETYCAGPDEG